MTDKSTFALKISGIDLNNINAGDLGQLLDEFCKLLGKENIFFESIYSGSAVAKVYTQKNLYTEKLALLEKNTAKNHKALQKIANVIRRYAKNFPDIEGKILASKEASNDENMDTIFQIKHQKAQSHTFEQMDDFVGKLLKPAHGKDDTDHFTILLSNEKEISVKVSKSLSLDIAPYLETLWNHSSLIKFNGHAKYEMHDSYELTLKDFQASTFEIIKNNTSAKSWADDFIEQGESGWQNFDNPEKVWLEERYS